jgi:hypothetical protein
MADSLDGIRDEVRRAQARDSVGSHDSSYDGYFDKLQARFKKPTPDQDWLIDDYMFVGAQKALVARASKDVACNLALAVKWDRAETSAHRILRHQIAQALHKRLNLPYDLADDVARGVESEALELAGFSASAISMPAFRSAGWGLLNSSHVIENCSVPFIAGYNAHNGREIYIDRDVPGAAFVNGRKIPVTLLLNIHESVEKALLDEYHLTYQHAHQIAVRVERMTARALAVNWDDYDKFIMKIYQQIESRPAQWIPDALDQLPYLSYADEDSLKLVRDMRANLVSPMLCPPPTVDKRR